MFVSQPFVIPRVVEWNIDEGPNIFACFMKSWVDLNDVEAFRLGHASPQRD